MPNPDPQIKRPLVSVITVVFNGEIHLQEAINSIRLQSYYPIEYIVIDGGSSDGTLEIISRNEDIISRWVSEADGGIYDAMNKGIRMASGKYIGLLNADDILISDAVKRVVDALEALGEPGYTCGAVELIDQLGRRFGVSKPMPENLRHKRRFLEMPCPHLGVFVHRAIYDQLGLFDTRFKVSADYDFLLRLIEGNVPSSEIYQPIGKYRVGGASGGIITFIETFSVHLIHNAGFFRSFYSFLRSLLKSNAAHLLPGALKKALNKTSSSKNSYD